MQDLYSWQHNVIDEAHDHPKRALFAAPRLGKTRATAIMLREAEVSRGLVVAPLSVLGAWDEELTLQGMNTLPLYLSTLSANSRALCALPEGIALVNYDRLSNLEPFLTMWKPKGQVYDESHLLKNPQSGRSKSARRVARFSDFCRILTGTPSPNHYGDLWAQMTLINPESWGKTWTPFANKYLVRHPIYPSKIIGYNNLPELQALLAQDADIIRREDVFGPDTFQYIDRWVELPEEARTIYSALVKEWLYFHERGDILADHTLKRLTRLRQLTSGFLRTEGKEDVAIHTAKLDAVMADLEEIIESGEKVVIFHRFTWEGNQYEQAIKARFGGVQYSRIYGAVPVAVRHERTREFNATSGAAIILAQTRTASLGISLREAEHAFFISQDFSFTDEDQARDRILKPGLPRCVSYYRARNTVDEFIKLVLEGKFSIHDAVMHSDVREMSYGK